MKAKVRKVSGITTKSSVLSGKPVIKGTRIPVSLIVNLVARGYTILRIVEAYPQLTRGDVTAALRYAEGLTKRERVLALPRISA